MSGMNTFDKEPAFDSKAASQDTPVIWHKKPQVRLVLIVVVIVLLGIFIHYASYRADTEVRDLQKMMSEMKR